MCFWVVVLFAHHTPCDHSLLGPLGKSRFTPLLTHNLGKVLLSSAVCCCEDLLRSSLQTSAFFFPLSQVYGLFEGMLEKLELDDDGKLRLLSFATFSAISPSLM